MNNQTMIKEVKNKKMRKRNSIYLVILLGIFITMAMVTSVSALTLGTGLNLTANDTGASVYVDSFAVTATQVVITNNSVEITGLFCPNNLASFTFWNQSGTNNATTMSAICAATPSAVAADSMCTSFENGLGGLGSTIYLLFAILGAIMVIGGVVYLVYAVKMQQAPESNTINYIVYTVIGIGVLIFVLFAVLLATSLVCSVGL